MRQFPVVLLILLPILACSQSTKIFRSATLTYSQLARTLEHPAWDTVVFEGITFKDDLAPQVWKDSLFLGDFYVSVISVGKVASLQFVKCQFPTDLLIRGVYGDLAFEECTGQSQLFLQQCHVRGLWIRESLFRLIYIDHSDFTDLIVDAEDLDVTTLLFRVSVDSGFLGLAGPRMRVEKSMFTITEEAQIDNSGQGNAWISIKDSHFEAVDSAWVVIRQSGGQIHLIENNFSGDVSLEGEGDKILWDLSKNKFGGKVAFSSTAEMGPASYFNFAEIFHNKPLGRRITRNNGEFFFNGGSDQISDERQFAILLRTHKGFHDFYLQGGDIQTANFLYARIKDLETRRLERQYAQSPSFDLWIRIHLNNLLKFYTRYGTDPARAIIISLWVIFWFGIFYLFFPSSWDVTSKSKLISDFRDLRNVSTGRYKSAFRLMINAAVALLNAFTLSLNSFVTLGFGEIPTKGVARYVTIAEGFLGWFLLTLFSVALISQSSF